MTNEDIVGRLDKLIAIFQLVHREEIEGARSAVRSDEVNATALDVAADWTPATELAAAIRRAHPHQAARTITRRIAALVEQGALQSSGATSGKKYKSTGVI